LVKNKLKRYQVELSDQPQLPILQLSSDKLERGTLSLFSSGQVAEYELTYSLSYQLIIPQRPPQHFSIQMRRDYLDDPQTAQAKSREMAQILKEMRVQAAEQIVRQLSRLK
jgi:LPS-assembly lipoprotein